jgi:hypothetical protein
MCPNDIHLNPKILREYFRYHPRGYLIRKKAISNGVGGKTFKKQTVRGWANCKGYMQFTFFGKTCFLHRAIFALINGFLPIQIDHINGIRNDNRIENLRASDNSKNQHGFRTKSKHNKSGIRGVHHNRSNNLWIGKISVNNRIFEVSSMDKKICIQKYNKLREEKLKEIGLV